MFCKLGSMTIDEEFKMFLDISNQIKLSIFSTYHFKSFFRIQNALHRNHHGFV